MSTRPSSFTSGCSLDSSATTILFGQHSSFFHKKSGPLSQRLLSIRHSAVKLLRTWSAGLDLESTYRHCSGEEPSWITERRFAAICVEPLWHVPDQMNNRGRVTPENTFNQRQVKLPSKHVIHHDGSRQLQTGDGYRSKWCQTGYSENVGAVNVTMAINKA